MNEILISKNILASPALGVKKSSRRSMESVRLLFFFIFAMQNLLNYIVLNESPSGLNVYLNIMIQPSGKKPQLRLRITGRLGR